ncbi:MAG: hypothetical protein KDB65_00850 [Calditrichaeota bacterium]|nr:hypothetical protein [Calditrichota bacterium]MCB9369235.1 hypothetical protein [Calditrichota bacterium]
MKKAVLLTSLLCMLVIATAAQARYRDDDLARIRIEGYVESIRGQIAYVRDDCGTMFRVHLGPAWYWDDRDYRLYSGSYVSIVAWMDYEEDYCYAGEIRGRDFCYDLCDSNGFPRWSDRDYCETAWRPTRSLFSIHFVFGGTFWHCYRPTYVHYRPWYVGCYNDHYTHRTWHPDHGRDRDRDHGRDRDHDRGGDYDQRGGRRDSGGGNNYGSDDSRNDSRGGIVKGDYDSRIVKPRTEVTKPETRKSEKGVNKVRVEKTRTSEKTRVSSTTRSKSSSKSSAKSSSKSSRGNSSKVDKSFARK